MITLCDTITEDGIRLYGSLHRSVCHSDTLVVIAHGYFSSNRIGPHRLYYHLASAMQSDGYDVVRYDLRGMGESDGNIEDVRFSNHVSDFEQIMLHHMKENKYEGYIIIAHCIGCSVSIPFIRKYGEYLEKVIFISPYFTTETTLDAFFDGKQKLELFRDGHTYRKGCYADLSFFEGINRYEDFIHEIRTFFHKPALISAGNDQYIPLQETLELYKRIGNIPIIIQGADHNYLDMQHRKELIKTIRELIHKRKV